VRKYSQTKESPEISQSAISFFIFWASGLSFPSSKRLVHFIVLSSEIDTFTRNVSCSLFIETEGTCDVNG
jgi:hypothetical protein